MRAISDRLPSAATLVWLTAVWVLLWGDLSWGNVVNGLLLGLFVTVLMPLPRVRGLGAFRPLAVAVLVGRFAIDVVGGALQVSRLALRRRPPHSAVVKVQLRSHSDAILAATGGLSSHVLDIPEDDPEAGIAALRGRVLAQEERLMRAFSSAAELVDAGYRPGWRVGSGRGVGS